MSNQTVLINTKLGVSKRKPRIWVEGHHLRAAGLHPGMTLGVQFSSGHGIVHAAGVSLAMEVADHCLAPYLNLDITA